MKKEQEFIITSTNNIEGGDISKYLGVINNNVVVGTNLFSDIGASLLDIFGGTSSSYQNKLKNIYETSIQNLKIKARNLGANAILGLSIDFDEISGGNKSMFMISVSGTAVFVDYLNNNLKKEFIKKDSISNELLKNELLKREVLDSIQNNKTLSQEEWYFLQQNPNLIISEKLLDNFLKEYGSSISMDSDKGKVLISNITNYFRALDKEVSINLLFDKLPENPTQVLNLLKKNNLFSPTKVLNLINKGEFGIAIICLNIDKENYLENDLIEMNKIVESFDNLENTGEIKTSKSLLGKDKEKFICKNGHTNDIESEFCETLNCLQNIKGLTKNQVGEVEIFRTKVEVLSYLFKQD
ncbi:YbjQ family protein [Polaribacter sp. AHE13PA]|jgi:uncharacterized protein YbjQ (UPF0145 family)|uniref:YbjQ family protein n=1 Tax=unclassified Polaribacter TaxID=196858 RepID=UPI001C4E8387|nr:YbjQ family protein [Polaribacter sp. AHE13PA]QXP66102.1 YbjQ family protein [Polaribacter sp. AHE13PA]